MDAQSTCLISVFGSLMCLLHPVAGAIHLEIYPFVKDIDYCLGDVAQ